MMLYLSNTLFALSFLAAFSQLVTFLSTTHTTGSPPSPACINGLAVELNPLVPPEDIDGDGWEDNGTMTIHAVDFIDITSPADTTGLLYSVNRKGADADPTQSDLTLTCKDIGAQMLEIWSWDATGNGEMCTTYLLVHENFVHCGNADPVMGGLILTEELQLLNGVEIILDGTDIVSTTGDNGFYPLPLGTDVTFETITPRMDREPSNGVSIFDMVLISKHILGIQVLPTPYRRIAADIDRSGYISVSDLIALRRLMLNIDQHFHNNTSWRFIPADYQFPDPENPWLEDFPESIVVDELSNTLTGYDFIAVKTGDVSLDAVTH